MKVVAALAMAVLLSGCTGHAPVPPGIPVDENGDALPTLHGIVVDDAIRPLAGARVLFLATGVNTTTDSAGRYEFHRPTMKAEAVLVTAVKDGYMPRTQQAQISGSHSVKLNFGLQADRWAVPHVDILKHSGTTRCTLAVAVAGQMQGANCDEGRADVDGNVAPWMWDIYADPALAGVVEEVHWTAQSSMAETLHVWLTAPVAGGHEGEMLVEATGKSPLRLEVPATLAKSFGPWTSVRLHVEVASAGNPGASQEQPYEAFAAVAYVDALPPGYTFV